MIQLVYDPDCGEAVSDGRAMVLARMIALQARQTFSVLSFSTANIFAAMRLLIATDELDSQSITFIYQNKSFRPNEYGAIPDWPEGFCDFEVDIDEQILQSATKKKKEVKHAYHQQNYHLESWRPGDVPQLPHDPSL